MMYNDNDDDDDIHIHTSGRSSSQGGMNACMMMPFSLMYCMTNGSMKIVNRNKITNY